MIDDQTFMRAALREAARGRGRTSPNPMVGCVIVAAGKIIARGWHHAAGQPHAEVEALANLPGRLASGATCYVTLEPCNHTGKTGPCTEALIAAGVGRVVIAMRDPHRIVDGTGILRLKQAGIHVDVGVLEAQAHALNPGFIAWATLGRPYVTLKAAVSLDGRMATHTGDARWVTGEAARREVHRLRDRSDAILVGAGTVRADDPELTTRLPGGRDPLRVIVDGRLTTPPTSRVVRPGTLIVTGAAAAATNAAALKDKGAEVLVLGDGHEVPLRALAQELGRRGVLELLVEGGAQVHAGFLTANLVDQVIIFIAPKLIGAGGIPLFAALGPPRMADVWRLGTVRTRRLGEDIMVTGELVKRDPAAPHQEDRPTGPLRQP